MTPPDQLAHELRSGGGQELQADLVGAAGVPEASHEGLGAGAAVEVEGDDDPVVRGGVHPASFRGGAVPGSHRGPRPARVSPPDTP
ncbi:hypothetical protein [Streptomyces sp. ICC1]|uniref:hypothetical protein n=1 Tax=Streptomyces sp. ICC1 TaxID=2099583 RepID=UPI001EF7D72F|nr:hypothetical protein [Streptomyces sp. ICC1]